MKKPSDLHYGVNEKPPFLILWTMVGQQILILMSYLVLVSVIANAAHIGASGAS